jgi:uncharacterized membrane protein (DUF485 family)
MPYLIAFIIGFSLGWLTAGKKGGNLPDKVQYGTVFGMIGMVLTLIALVIYGNML